jgi:hypothetical protein
MNCPFQTLIRIFFLNHKKLSFQQILTRKIIPWICWFGKLPGCYCAYGSEVSSGVCEITKFCFWADSRRTGKMAVRPVGYSYTLTGFAVVQILLEILCTYDGTEWFVFSSGTQPATAISRGMSQNQANSENGGPTQSLTQRTKLNGMVCNDNTTKIYRGHIKINAMTLLFHGHVFQYTRMSG